MKLQNNPNFKIRRMQEKDVNEVYEIGSRSPELESRPGSGWYSRDHLRRWLKDKDAVLLVAETSGKVVGFVLSTLHPERLTGYLEEIAVSEDYRGKGIGSALFDKSLQMLKEKGASYFYGLVQTDNKNMVEFLEKRGFKTGYPFYWMEKEEK